MAATLQVIHVLVGIGPSNATNQLLAAATESWFWKTEE